MKTKKLNLPLLVLLSAGLLTLTSCSSTSSSPTPVTTSAVSFERGVPGGIFVETQTVTATVTAIDAPNRKWTLATPDGTQTIVKCGPEIINFDQIHVGDRLTGTLTEELVAYLAGAGESPTAAAATTVVLAPKGAKPGGVIADTVQVKARVTAIDLKHHKATLQFPDGTTKTIPVRKDVDLSQRKVGEEVVIRVTDRVAIHVSKPQ